MPTLSYADRALSCTSSPLARKLFLLMEKKKTNLALSADVTSAEELIALAETLGSEICILKTHIDIIEDFTPQLTQTLRKLADELQFLIFEDRKFADIGNTVKHQYSGGVYHIAEWADLVNAHVIPGPGIIKGLAEIGRPKERGLILLAEMSSAGHLMTPEYIQQTLGMAENFSDFVIGFITQHAVSPNPCWINLTPGVRFQAEGDGLDQQYVTPSMAISQGSDVIIVGRGILTAADRLGEAKRYRHEGWTQYLKR